MAESSTSAEERRCVLSEIHRLGERFDLRIYDEALSHDHVHLLLKIPHRREYAKFIRSLTGLLARKFGKGFWMQLPYSRIAHWGRDYKNLQRYLEQNRLEASGEMPYRLRFWKLSDFYDPHVVAVNEALSAR